MIPPILCITGPSGSGKTCLLERLIPRLAALGLRVGAIKHCGHIGSSSSGKDSNRLARAGASPVIAAAKDRIEIQNADREPLLLDLVTAFCTDCDLILAEGYSRSVHDKILLRRREEPEPLRNVESVRLIVGDGKAAGIERNDIDGLTVWVPAWYERRQTFRKGIIGAILTGGTSGRMGTDKSRLRIGGRRVLGRLCELLADRTGQAIIVGQQPEGQDIPACARWHPDITPGLGPLGGIATALQVAASEDQSWGICVAACDMPLVQGDLLDHLLTGRNPDAPATVPLNPASGRLEPLFAVYEPQSLQSIKQALDSGERSVTDWLESAGAYRLTIPGELADQLANVNTPNDLGAIRLSREGRKSRG